jgi:hypothetical protein
MNNMTFGTAIAVVLAASLSSAAAGPLLSQSVTDGSGVIGSEVVGSGEVQHSWNGRTYCWSESGWKGAGWYRCGFAARRGLGWGGPAGWHGWSQETSSDVPVKRRSSGSAFRSTPTPRELRASGSLRNGTPNVAPLSGSRSSGGILNSPLTNPSATSSGSLSGSGGAASSGSSSGLGGSTSSTSGSGSSTSSSSSASPVAGGR